MSLLSCFIGRSIDKKSFQAQSDCRPKRVLESFMENPDWSLHKLPKRELRLPVCPLRTVT
jgi:hypothetical protein